MGTTSMIPFLGAANPIGTWIIRIGVYCWTQVVVCPRSCVIIMVYCDLRVVIEAS
jgi:hypothetical protein